MRLRLTAEIIQVLEKFTKWVTTPWNLVVHTSNTITYLSLNLDKCHHPSIAISSSLAHLFN